VSLPFEFTAPWLAPLRPWLDRLPADVPAVEALNRVADPAGPRFVAQDALPAGEAYEAFIARTGAVPTRDLLHDLFNGLVWQRHPALKRRLNALQAHETHRPVLSVLTNLAVMLVLGIAVQPAGPQPFLTANGLNLGMLLGFAAVMGFGGAFISLLISKPMAKWSTKAQVINDSTDPTHRWIVGTVAASPEGRHPDARGRRSTRASPTPSPPAPSRTRRWWRCPPACCTHDREEVEAVIGHEVAHVANGDMVTMTLIQGVMNTFVVFLSRVIGYFVDKVVLRNDATAGHRLLRDHHRARHRAGRAGRDHRGLVLAPARVPRRRRRRAADGPQAADDQRAGPPGRPGPGRAAEGGVQTMGISGRPAA
jgi:hypothetical protein